MLKRFIGTKAFYRNVLALLIPMVIQQFITSFVSLLDNIMVGSLGTEAISAASISNSVLMVHMLAIFGGMSGASIYGAQFFGKGDMDGMRHTFRFKLYFGVIFSAAAIAVYLLFGSSFIQSFLRGDSNGGDLVLTHSLGNGYLRVMLWGLIPFALAQVYTGTLRESGETRAPMVAGIIAILTNLFLNWVLIYGHLGAPALGVEGAAIATVISRYVELLKSIHALEAAPGDLPDARRVFVTVAERMAGDIGKRNAGRVIKMLEAMPENQGHLVDNTGKTAEDLIRCLDPEQFLVDRNSGNAD